MTQLLELPPTAGRALDINGVVAELGKIRASFQKHKYGAGRLPELPSREAATEIISRLVAVLYPRHFGPPGLRAEDLDLFLTKSLEATSRLLREQALRELLLLPDGLDNDPEKRSAQITHVFIESLPGIRALLDTDIRAAFEGDPAAKSYDEIVFCYPGVAAIIRHRLAHLLYRLGVPLLARIIAESAHSETGIDIHPGAEIGEGFFIDHGTGVVIGETAVIGRRVRLYQAVTLGAKRFEIDENGALAKGGARHPIIEDEVTIYAGATVLGRITIGRGSSIGGNVWLTHSVPPGSNVTQAKARTEAFFDGGGI
ncbi:serine O-acetyltransferase EpsC [Methylocystis sp. ATCC 49242]|uniref:serine O-acetyltransferase EpsC n=1 Tax=Methylocystis sp. ATCC 49242 TaxID=622637 RepID=UPI0001F86884|nr:serine O-acetyltransferase EpsC [Methylocystis sp. ATCC 49242]